MKDMISTNIQKAKDLLTSEEIIAIPTETVYGLAGNIYSEKAISNIFLLKSRPFFNPLIVHIHSLKQLNEVVSYIPPKAKILAEVFWPGPLTLVLPKKNHISDLVTSGKTTVAVRIPNHKVTLELLKGLDFPLAAPSANPFGSISPTQADHVSNYFGDKLGMVLDGGSCIKGIESTIVGFEGDEPVLFRLGSVSLESIEKEIGVVTIKNKKEISPDAPGMLMKHYAPNTPTYLVSKIIDVFDDYKDKKVGFLSLDNSAELSKQFHHEVLSMSGDLDEAAAKLYSALHRLDKMNLDALVLERFPNHGIGKAINDKLERAAYSN